MARVSPHQNDDWFHCQEALTYREEPRVYEYLTVASSIMIATGGVRDGRPESTAAFIFSRLGTEQRPRSGVAPPLECLRTSTVGGTGGDIRYQRYSQAGGIPYICTSYWIQTTHFLLMNQRSVPTY